MYRAKTLFFVYLFFGLQLFSQTSHTIDSLKQVVKTLENDTAEIIALNDLCWYYRAIDPDSALYFGELSLKKSSALSYNGGTAMAYNNIGNAWSDVGDYEKSLTNHLKALAIREKINDKKGVASSLNNLGILYKLQGNFQKAIKYYNASLKIREELNDNYGIAAAFNNMGNIYILLKDHDKALENYNRSLKIRTEINDKQGIAVCLNNIANLFYESGNNQKALDYYLRSLAVARETGNSNGVAGTLNNIGSTYSVMKENDRAIEYLNRSLEEARRINAADIVKECYNWLGETYAQMGDYRTAFDYHKRYVALKDSIYTEESDTRFKEMEAKYDKEKNEKEIQLLNGENQKKRLIIYSVCAGLFLLSVLTLLILNRSRLKQRSAEVLQQQKREIERLSIVASETENVILIMDNTGKLEWVNSSFEKLNGITLKDLIKLKGETIFDISNNPNIRQIVSEAVEEKKSVVYESFNKTQDGKLVWESSTLTPIFDEQGKLKKIIIIDTNVTDRKHAEELVLEQNKEILDSIRYAKRIQGALLASDQLLKDNLPDHFILYKPKDIVSGDFYWAAKKQKDKEEQFYMVAADSTGHGVPGAFMSLLNISFLNEAINTTDLQNPDEILGYVRKHIIGALKTDGSEEGGKDGMDAVISMFDFKQMTMKFAAANNPVWIVRAASQELEKNAPEIIELNADKMPVGLSPRYNEPFTLQTIQLQKGDIVYLFTDGYADQFGGPKGKKFKYKQFKEVLLANASRPMNEQHIILEQKINDWKGPLEQVDDILVIGIKV